MLLNGIVAKPYTQTNQVAGPLTPVVGGDLAATPRGLRPISLEGFSEDVNQDGFVDPLAPAAPIVAAAPVVAAPAITTAYAAGPALAPIATSALAAPAITTAYAAAPAIAATYAAAAPAIAAPVIAGPRLAQQALLSPNVYASAPRVDAPLTPYATQFAAPIATIAAGPATTIITA